MMLTRSVWHLIGAILTASVCLPCMADEPAKQPNPREELERIANFFQQEKGNEPAILGRILRSEAKDERTVGDVSINGTSTHIYHTLEKTPDGLRLKSSTVHDTMLFDLDEHGKRVLPGRSGYRVEVAEIELKVPRGNTNVHGFLRNISNSRFDPVGWSVEISEARVIENGGGKRGTLVLKTKQIGNSATFAKDNNFIPTTWEAEVTLKLDEDGKLLSTYTTTDYIIDPKTGARKIIGSNPEKRIVNPSTIVAREP